MNPFGFWDETFKNVMNIQKNYFDNAFQAAEGFLDQAEAVNAAYLARTPWISPDGQKTLSAGLILQRVQISYLKALYQEAYGVFNLVNNWKSFI